MFLRLLLVPMALGAVPALAQEAPAPAPTPSVEGYLCTFAGKCDGADEGPQAVRDAPETKGFRLARPTATAGGSRSAAPVGRARTPGAAFATRTPRERATSYGVRPARAAGAARAAAVPGAGAGGPRADLLIGFELNSAQLTAEGAHAVQVFARSLLTPELGAKRFLIEGHTDLRGGRRLNVDLSARRAQAVAGYLAVLGVERGRLETRGMGARAPLPGHRASDPANRRVEAELIR